MHHGERAYKRRGKVGFSRSTFLYFVLVFALSNQDTTSQHRQNTTRKTRCHAGAHTHHTQNEPIGGIEQTLLKRKDPNLQESEADLRSTARGRWTCPCVGGYGLRQHNHNGFVWCRESRDTRDKRRLVERLKGHTTSVQWHATSTGIG